jgi:hypothetical protein
VIIEPDLGNNKDGISRLTDDRFDARNACDTCVKALVDVLTNDAFRDFDVVFQMARLDGNACDESDLLVLIPQ